MYGVLAHHGAAVIVAAVALEGGGKQLEGHHGVLFQPQREGQLAVLRGEALGGHQGLGALLEQGRLGGGELAGLAQVMPHLQGVGVVLVHGLGEQTPLPPPR